MFSGIIETTGLIKDKVKRGSGIAFQVETTGKNFLKEIQPGSSIAINGACMTVEKIQKNNFEFTTIKESLSKTNLGLLEKGSYVNLEKPLKLNSFIDGHLVQGHVDATGKIEKIKDVKQSREYFISFSKKFKNFIIYAGSITINGTSLTIADIAKAGKKNIMVKVAIIPYTLEHTIFKYIKVNDVVNIEFDMVGKYISRNLNKK
jgi:riboflavin synthase